MRKRMLPVVFLCLCAGMLLSAGSTANHQKIYPVDSSAYEAITYLFVSQGHALPSTSGPWSEDELIRMLDKIDRSKLSGGALRTYDFVASQLNDDKEPVEFGLNVAIEGYYHTNTEDFVQEEDWIRGFNERKPLLDLILETWPSEHFYGYSSLSLGNNCYNGWDEATGTATSTFFGSSTFTTNIIMVPPAVLDDVDASIPYRAFGAFGGDQWSVQIGRDKMSWGPGVSGNFVLGDHLLYHNMGRFTTYNDSFKYTFATSFFPHPSEYYVSSTYPYIKNSSQNAVSSGLNMFMAHRLEWRLFSDSVGIALTEAMMYQSADNTLDLRILNPAMIFHDYYIRHNANSIISFELDYTPISFFNIYGQVVVDEFALPGEPVPGVDDDALPSGYGFMLGTKGSRPVGKGMFFGSLEWAKTDPYLYLRDNGDRDQDPGEYGLNWVVALRQFSNGAGVTYTEEFLGYQYGGDAIVLNANLGYKEFGKWSLEGNFFYMLHGTHDKWTLWSYVDNGDGVDDDDPPNVTTPTTTHSTGNNADKNASDRDSVCHTVVVGLNGSYSVLPNLDLYAQADYIHIRNPGNISTAAPTDDVQLTFGVSYSL